MSVIKQKHFNNIIIIRIIVIIYKYIILQFCIALSSQWIFLIGTACMIENKHIELCTQCRTDKFTAVWKILGSPFNSISKTVFSKENFCCLKIFFEDKNKLTEKILSHQISVECGFLIPLCTKYLLLRCLIVTENFVFPKEWRFLSLTFLFWWFKLQYFVEILT